jgi:exodeoxyribonuclease VII large subunit
LNAVAPRLRPQLLLDRVSRTSERLESLWKMARLVHPDRPLSRGFARVTDRSGKTLAKAADARSAKLLSLHFIDGKVDASTAESAPVERRPRPPYVDNQPGFFDDEVS